MQMYIFLKSFEVRSNKRRVLCNGFISRGFCITANHSILFKVRLKALRGWIATQRKVNSAIKLDYKDTFYQVPLLFGCRRIICLFWLNIVYI